MKSKILRICISFLAVLFVFISLPVMNASAETTSDGIVYKISGGEVTITDYTGNAKNLTIPSKIEGYPVTSIGESAFYDCNSLTSIEIPLGVTSIGKGAFSGCSALKRMVVDKNNPVYDSRDNCNAIIKTATNTLLSGCSKTEIPSSVTSISDSAFYYCDSLTSITIPSGVTSIGEDAFSFCYSLTSITIPSSVTSIGDTAFYSCDSLTSIEIPAGVTSIGDWAFVGCSVLKLMVVDKNNPVYDSRDNCNAIIETATNTLIAGCSKTEIPSSVTSIGEAAFLYCDSLTSITIPSGVTSIGEGAFSGCLALKRMVVDKNNPVYDSRDNCNAIIKTATNTLIAGCSKTEIPSSVTSIGEDAFYYCDSLTSIEIPEGVTSVGDSAFSYCDSLTSITIPSGVTSIGYRAFYSCDSLSDVYYEGGEEDWKSISIGYYNESLTEAKIHFNSESEEKVSSGMKILGFIGIALIALAVVVMWVFIVKKIRKV